MTTNFCFTPILFNMLKLVLFNNHFYYHRSILYLNNVLFNVLEDSVTKLLASAAAAVAAHR